MNFYGLGAPPTDGPSCEMACVNGFTTSDAYYKCIANCEALFPPGVATTTTLPPGVTPTTTSNLPGDLAPPPGYQPAAATNWWRIGIAAAIGLGLGLAVYSRGRHAQ